ncbi:hypothetical protein LSTR_LSTR006158 [Laodelphax striatellus]|uniref:Hexosyltransferase n=2 Tax=Laodelphax striatellus TaxID=195883 RepID=A0A482WYI9_LAOST|nr:hypothetical protein LSTR_LSTR006158 [Laodelphax striatellus]
MMKYQRSKMKILNYVLYILSFILGSTITLFFISIEDRDGLGDGDVFAKLKHKVSLQNISNRYFLLILIISKPDNIERRDTIRNTWLQFVKDDSSVKPFFVIGAGGLNADQQLKLKEEYSENKDILSLTSIPDSYGNLTSKILTSFVLLEKEYTFKFLLKCDDDSFVQASAITKELKTTYRDEEYLYWGYFDGRAHVKRSGKWKEEDWFLCDRYLPYALGGGYVLSEPLVKFIARNAELLKMYKSEDVSVGVWLAPLNIKRLHDQRFDTEFLSRGCLNKHLVTHKHSNRVLRHLYSETVTHGRMCTQEVLSRPSYNYNWQAPPSLCCNRNESTILVH